MNATPHTLAGIIAIKLASTNIYLGCALAMLTHFGLDYINEAGFKKKDRTIFDMIPLIICFCFSIYTGNIMLFVQGWFFGNLPDIIDKKAYLTIFFPKKFKSTEYLHWFITPFIHPKVNTTRIIGIVSMIIIIFIIK
tara:strand:+ start:96 stop:506 length:411 start_codon:yes stop_codon:yes gene_type:complete